MSTSSLGTIAKESVGWSIGLSVLMIIAGVLAIVIPPVAGIAVLVVVAWLLMFSGAVHLVFAWHTRTAGGMIWELLLGILYIFVGVYALASPRGGLGIPHAFPSDLPFCGGGAGTHLVVPSPSDAWIELAAV